MRENKRIRKNKFFKIAVIGILLSLGMIFFSQGVDATANSCTCGGTYINGICDTDSTHFQEPTKLTSSNWWDYESLGSSYIGYYVISNSGELFWFANAINTSVISTSANAVLLEDIVVNDNIIDQNGNYVADSSNERLSWTPIGTETNEYEGTFDGLGHIIKGLYIDKEDM